ncbi:MAG: site-specific integrase [Candidatus Aenigmatarchaeota archaeon]
MPGSIQKRGKNKYLLVVSAGFDITGKRIRHTKVITANSDAEAEKQLALFYAEVMKGNIRNDQQLTLGEYCKHWIETKEKKLSSKTIDGYKKLLKRINEALGHIRLAKLKPRHLVEFYNLLREENLTENTISHYHRFLHAVLETAYKVDKLIPENPAKAVIDPPTPGRPRPHFYDDDEQILKLLKALNNAPIKYKMFVILALETGARRGELLGLEWKDIDFEKGIIYIRRASNYTKENGIYTSTTKTETSVRKLSITEELIAFLKEYKKWQNELRLQKGDKWIDTDRLFTQDNGMPMHPDTPDKWFKKFLRENNLPPITIHGLRHTNASIMIANDVDIITIAERLGHADKSTPVRIYGHMLNKKEKQAAETIANATVRKIKEQQ